MSEKSEDLELFHYGVKGMKWGVSRPEGPDGRIKKSGGIRQKLKDRDESIKSARKGGVKEAAAKEQEAYSAAKKAKAARKGDRKNPEKKAEAKAKVKEANDAFRELQKTKGQSQKLTTKEHLTIGALYAAPAIIGTGYLASGTIGTRRNASIGKQHAADLFSDSRGLNAPGTIALNLVNGKWQ